MANFMLVYRVKYEKNRVECETHKSIMDAWLDWDMAVKVHGEDNIFFAIILYDDEGYSHPENAGKYFLYRIIK